MHQCVSLWAEVLAPWQRWYKILLPFMLGSLPTISPLTPQALGFIPRTPSMQSPRLTILSQCSMLLQGSCPWMSPVLAWTQVQFQHPLL